MKGRKEERKYQLPKGSEVPLSCSSFISKFDFLTFNGRSRAAAQIGTKSCRIGKYTPPTSSVIQPGLRPSQPGLRPSHLGLRLNQLGLRPSLPALRSSQPGLSSSQPARHEALLWLQFCPSWLGRRPG